MPRTFHVEGTRKFLVAAIVLMIIGLWCVKDGWFPSEYYLKKYPPGGGRESDNFYAFNQSLGIGSLVISAICAYIHRIVK